MKNQVWYGVKSDRITIRGVFERIEAAERIACRESKLDNQVWKVVAGDKIFAEYQNGQKIV